MKLFFVCLGSFLHAANIDLSCSYPYNYVLHPTYHPDFIKNQHILKKEIRNLRPDIEHEKIGNYLNIIPIEDFLKSHFNEENKTHYINSIYKMCQTSSLEELEETLLSIKKYDPAYLIVEEKIKEKKERIAPLLLDTDCAKTLVEYIFNTNNLDLEIPDEKIKKNAEILKNFLNMNGFERKKISETEMELYRDAASFMFQLGKIVEVEELKSIGSLVNISLTWSAASNLFQMMLEGINLINLFNNKKESLDNFVSHQLITLKEQNHFFCLKNIFDENVRKSFEEISLALSEITSFLCNQKYAEEIFCLKIESLKTIVKNYQDINKISLEKPIFSKIHSMIFKILESNNVYFQEMEIDAFHNFCLDFFNCIELCFDPGFHNEDFKNLSDSIKNSGNEHGIGHLATRLGSNNSAVLRKLFQNSLEAFSILLERGLPLYGDLPTSNFKDRLSKLIDVIKERNLFIQNIYKNIPNFFDEYQKSFLSLKNLFESWKKKKEEELGIDITLSEESLTLEQLTLNHFYAHFAPNFNYPTHTLDIGDIDIQETLEKKNLLSVFQKASLLEKLKGGHIDLTYCGCTEENNPYPINIKINGQLYKKYALDIYLTCNLLYDNQSYSIFEERYLAHKWLAEKSNSELLKQYLEDKNKWRSIFYHLHTSYEDIISDLKKWNQECLHNFRYSFFSDHKDEIEKLQHHLNDFQKMIKKIFELHGNYTINILSGDDIVASLQNLIKQETFSPFSEKELDIQSLIELIEIPSPDQSSCLSFYKASIEKLQEIESRYLFLLNQAHEFNVLKKQFAQEEQEAIEKERDSIIEKINHLLEYLKKI